MAGLPHKYTGTVLAFGERATINAGLTRYLAAAGGTSLASELAVVVPRDGKLRNLRWSAAASGLTGANNKISVYVNGATTPLEAAWNGALLSGGNSTTEVQVLAGNTVSVRIQLAAGGTSITRPRVSIELEMDSTSRWLADDPNDTNSNIYYVGGGNIGIGTDTPGEKLSADGIIESETGGFKFPDGTLQTTAFGGFGGINALTGAGGTPPDAVYVDGSGRVGIGIGSARMPQEKLTLAPDSNFAVEMTAPSGLTANPKTDGSLPPGSYTFWVSASDGMGWTKASDPLTRALGGSFNGFAITWQPVLGAVNYRLYREVGTAPGEYKYIETVSNTYDYNSDAPFVPDFPPYPLLPDQTDAFINKLSASGPSWLLGGKVGIGTISPTEKLQVSGGNAVIDGSVGIGTPNPAGKLQVSGGNAIFDGNVGVGTPNPLAKLEVAGNAVVDGNVGIGTSNPTSPLHIARDSETVVLRIAIQDTNPQNPKMWFLGNDGALGKFGLIDGSYPNYRWIVDSNGNVGIGTTNPSTKLQVEGDVVISGRLATSGIGFASNPGIHTWDVLAYGALYTAHGTQTLSSRRFKTNIQPIHAALNKVLQLCGVTFDWKEDRKHNIGLIAEEVGNVIPEVVSYEENGTDVRGLDYSRLVAVLIEAVKEQQGQIDELKVALKSLMAEKQETKGTLVAEPS